jgi:hypothetical protein
MDMCSEEAIGPNPVRSWRRKLPVCARWRRYIGSSRRAANSTIGKCARSGLGHGGGPRVRELRWKGLPGRPVGRCRAGQRRPQEGEGELGTYRKPKIHEDRASTDLSPRLPLTRIRCSGAETQVGQDEKIGKGRAERTAVCLITSSDWLIPSQKVGIFSN